MKALQYILFSFISAALIIACKKEEHKPDTDIRGVKESRTQEKSTPEDTEIVSQKN